MLTKRVGELVAEGYREAYAILIEWDDASEKDKESLSLGQLQSILNFLKYVITVGTVTESEVRELIRKKAEELSAKPKC